MDATATAPPQPPPVECPYCRETVVAVPYRTHHTHRPFPSCPRCGDDLTARIAEAERIARLELAAGSAT